MTMGKDVVYKPRLIDEEISSNMRLFGCVAITGPKWCGKTTTADRIANTAVDLQNCDEYDRYRKVANLDPSLLLRGDTPVLVDEWQKIPEVWDATRYQTDLRNKRGLFILTSSRTINESEIEHSGAGRISRLRMRTMSLWESGRSTGDVCLSKLFEGQDSISGLPEYDYEQMARNLVRGGWPGTQDSSELDAFRMIESYCNAIIDTNLRLESESIESGKTKNTRRGRTMHNVLRSLSQASGSETSLAKIRDDVIQNGTSISINTLYSYVEALQNIYVTENLQPWIPQLRTRTAIRTTDTRHFSDPSMAAYFLDAGPEKLIYDPNTFELLFRTMAIRDLRVYAQTLDGHVCHYRDKDGLEVDAIIRLPQGTWAAVEVKLNDCWADEASKNLITLRNKMAPGMKPPAFLAVITADGAAYTREDGVHVIPLSCLRN